MLKGWLLLLLLLLLLHGAASLDPQHAGVGLAMFNAVCAAIGGFAANAIAGGLTQRMGSFSLATVVMGVFMAAAGGLALGLGIYQQCWQRQRQQQQQLQAEEQLEQQQQELRYRLGSRCTSSSLMQMQ
jgi:ABC-type nitrate/sulfonate/bicarbonate transport system permease component